MINHQSNEVFFDDLEVPAENLIGEEGQGFRYILDGMNAERILLSAESLGDCRYFIRRASQYASERVVFDRPIGQNQGVQFPIARAYAEWKAADMLCRARRQRCSRPAGPAARRRIPPSCCWPRRPPGTPGSLHADLRRLCARPANSTSSAKWREARLMRIAPISTNLDPAPILASTCSGCRGRIDPRGRPRIVGSRPAHYEGVPLRRRVFPVACPLPPTSSGR